LKWVPATYQTISNQYGLSLQRLPEGQFFP
jgi:hypothetical protein